MNLVSRINVVKLLVAKNWKIRLHYKKSFALLFLMPILLVGLVVILTCVVSPKLWTINKDQNVSHTGDRIVYNSSTLFGQLRVNNDNGQSIPLFYAPNNTYINQLMQRVAKVLTEKFNFKYKFDPKGYNNEEQMYKTINDIGEKM